MQANEIVRKVILAEYPRCEVVVIPLADGGEGTLDILCSLSEMHRYTIPVRDPLMRTIEASYGYCENEKRAVVEIAKASGLTLLTPDEYNPEETSSYGSGMLIMDALERGAREVWVTLGGSATNDGGTGLLSALGFRFLDRNGKEIHGCGGNLSQIASIDASHKHPALDKTDFRVVCDVNNLFCGEQGATRVFAPQKGASPQLVETLERGMSDWQRIIREFTGVDFEDVPGSGAAGGIGGALVALLNASVFPGAAFMLDMFGFEDRLKNASLVITGEGGMDKQTLMGKGPGTVMRRAVDKGIPVIGFCGSLHDTEALDNAGFTAVFSILHTAGSLAEAMKTEVAGNNLLHAVQQVLRMRHVFTL